MAREMTNTRFLSGELPPPALQEIESGLGFFSGFVLLGKEREQESFFFSFLLLLLCVRN